ncbi:hypothetical protein PsYK624_173030 [Phanerochaete sordida]|uniref:Uncharacterized protein n=1 Tax=Phanerochaete sordida TaxID=48140 RepID=A0A9P3GSC1_9APHY|nr:hypothetical protein PsYK624_173030 [Phanerochaete sordida]
MSARARRGISARMTSVACPSRASRSCLPPSRFCHTLLSATATLRHRWSLPRRPHVAQTPALARVRRPAREGDLLAAMLVAYWRPRPGPLRPTSQASPCLAKRQGRTAFRGGGPRRSRAPLVYLQSNAAFHKYLQEPPSTRTTMSVPNEQISSPRDGSAALRAPTTGCGSQGCGSRDYAGHTEAAGTLGRRYESLEVMRVRDKEYLKRERSVRG